MNESGQVYNYNKLRTIRTLADIISQCIVAFAFSAFVILGLTNKSDSYIIATLLMAVPVIITYAARKNIYKNFLFMLIHAALLITAIIIGNGDAESTAYFVSVLAVCIRSVSIRVANARKTEYMNEPLYGNQFADVTQEDKKAAPQAGERMSPLYCLVMVAGSLYGGSAGNRLLVNYEIVLFVLFVLLAFLANQLKELNSLFISNAGKSEFPAERITGINMIMVMVVSGLMILGMILFYSGDYGNIFTLIGSGFAAVIRMVIKLFLRLIREKEEVSTIPEDSVDPVTDDDVVKGDNDLAFTDNPVMSALFTAFAIVLVIALVVFIVYMIIRYAKNFKKSQDDNGDEIEFIGNDRRTEARIKRRQRAEEAKNMPVNMQYRKAFRKAAIKSSKAARDSDGKSLENMQPQDITINRITDDADAADRITESYEKARYSDKNISKEELEFMLDFIKNDKYNKRT